MAIKVLPEAFVADPDRLARFEREARVLASVSQPNTAGIFEVGQETLPASEEDTADSPHAPTPSPPQVHYLIMELAPGETLAERIARGPIPAW